MIFILDKKERVINTLKNNYSSSNNNPFFNDVLIQDLATGAESYSFSTFANGTITNDIVIGNYVAFQHKNSYKLFQITNVEIVHEETMEISVYSECAGLSLLNNVFRSRKMTSCTLRNFIDAVVENTDWNTGLIEEAVNSADLDIETSSCYSVLQQNISSFDVELEFRVELNHGRVSAKYIDTYKQRGKITGKRFTYGRDIEKVVKTVNSEQLYTALIGEGKDGATFRDITIPGIDKPLGQDFVADNESFQKYNRNGYHLMGVYSVDSDSPEVILRKTYAKLQEVKEPKISYEIPVLMLGELLGLEWDKVSIGDQIGILDTEFNPPLMLSARVSNLQISKSNPESSKCTLSNFIEVSSNITDEMRKIASKLEGYVEKKFPISGNDIAEGAINDFHVDKIYKTQIRADLIEATKIEAEQIVTNKIEAVTGEFENIKTDVLKAKEIATEALDANVITAGRVDAVEGNFTTLNSTVGTIETLVNGNLTSDHIQAGAISGDRLNMDTVSITNANIVDVSAGKINSGEINTNKVHIQSENGGIIIADNTQQFKDKNGKVRIQMGQDATGTFSFGVFDETGTGVLIDAKGVKEKALADGVIKNRMIGTGEIGGEKINISSLITEVNKETNASSIKASKILLDTENQKLSVAFSSLKSTATDAKSIADSATTSIGIEKGRIDTLIANTTIEKDGESLTLKDAYTQTSQTVDSLKTTVGQHTTKWEGYDTFVSNTTTTLQQHTDEIAAKASSSYVEETFKSTVKTVDVMYYLSTSSTTQTGGSWVTTAPAWEKGKYIWTKTVTTYVSGTSKETIPVCISGVNGSDGKGVKSIVEQYYLSTSATSQAGGTWSETVPAWVDGKYMWTRSVITYTDSTTTTTNPVCVTGGRGASGVGISTVDVEYYLSTSSTTQTGGSWSTTAPDWVDGKYMWSRTKTVTTAGTTTYSNPVCITGGKGVSGAVGQGVDTITEEYYLSNSKTAQEGGAWVTTPPTWSTGKYMWTRSKIVYKNPVATAYTTPVCDSSWEAINEIQIGGTNLILNSSFLDSTKNWTPESLTVSVVDDSVYKKALKISNPSGQRIYQLVNNVWKSGQIYTVSFYAKSSVAGGTISPSRSLIDYGATQKLTTEWQRYSCTIMSQDTITGGTLSLSFSNASEIYITRVKLEIGNKVTDWAPAPEDMEETVRVLTERVRDAELKISSEAIVATVTGSTSWSTVSSAASTAKTTADAAKSTADTAKTTADAAKSTATSASSTASSALSTANSANSTATSASSAASSAVSTANSASSTASSALSTANTAKSTADTALSTAITGNLYVKGTGANRNAPRLVQLNGTTVVNNASRGMNLLVIRRSDLVVVSSTNYDVYGDGNARTSLTTALNGLNDTVIVVITSYDAMATDEGLDAAICRCGGTGTRFGGSFHRVPYALVGIPGIGKGAGIEVFTSVDATAPYAEISTKILNGTPQGINTTIREITTRMDAAELKITESAIISTVQSTINTAMNTATNNANSATDNKLKSYATTSAVKQTASDILLSFSASGGYNLLKNSKARNGTKYWVSNGGGCASTSDSMFTTCFRTTGPSGMKYSEALKLKNNTDYVYEGYLYSRQTTPGSSVVPLHFWCNTTAGGTGQPQATIIDYRQEITTVNKWTKCYVHFKTAASGDVYFTPFVYFGGSTTFDFWVTELSLSESAIEMPWSPHPSEVYDGSTLIDGSGVTIKNGAISIENNAGTVVMNSDVNGNLLLNGGNLKIQNARGGIMDIVQFNGGTSGPSLSFSSGNSSDGVSIGLNINDINKMDIWADSLALKGISSGNCSLSAGAITANGNLTATGAVYASNWLRTYGATGWYNESYGGGWYMSDSSWIRAHNNKGVTTGGNIESGADIRCGNRLYFTKSEWGYYAYAQWYNNKACIRMPHVATGDVEADGNIIARGGVIQLGFSSNASYAAFYDSTGVRKGYVGKGSTTNDDLYLCADVSKYVKSIGHLCPSSTNEYYLGVNSPQFQWKGLCCVGGTFGTSDIKAKENIERLDGAIVSFNEVNEELKEYQLFNFRKSTRANSNDYYEFIKDRFKPSYYNYKLSEGINELTGEFIINPEQEYKLLKNVGFIAQDYDLENDKVAQEFIFKNEDGSLGYNHMSYVTVGMVALQEATKKIDALEKQNKELEDRLKILEDLILSK